MVPLKQTLNFMRPVLIVQKFKYLFLGGGEGGGMFFSMSPNSIENNKLT